VIGFTNIILQDIEIATLDGLCGLCGQS